MKNMYFPNWIIRTIIIIPNEKVWLKVGGYMKKTVVITGGANGIGKAISELFASKKYNTIIIDNDFIAINKVKNKHIYCYYADISNEEQVSLVMKSIHLKFKNIDILINNASKQTCSRFEDMNFSEWKSIIDTNLNGTFLCIKNSLNYMVSGSTILNIISVHYNKPRVNKYHYDASKAAVAILTKELAIELSEKNITINALSFGAVNTKMNEDWINNKQIVDETLKRIPLKKIFEPKEIASFVHNIIDVYSKYTTGSIFTIDAGRSLL